MHPILFKIGPFVLYSFSFLVALGLLLGCFVVWKYGREEHSEEKLFDTVLVTFIFSIIASRISYVVIHFDFFGLNVLKWILFSHYPGFSFWGGFIGAVFALVVLTRKKDIFRKFIDIFSLAVSLVMIFGNLGCFFGGCIIGKPANLPWSVTFPGYEYTRHPLSLYLFLTDIFIIFFVFKIFFYLKEKRRDLFKEEPGLTGIFYLSLYFVVRGAAEFYREKSFNISNIPILGLVFIFFGLAGLVWFYKKIGRSFKRDFKTIFSKIYDKILTLKKKKNTIFLLNDSIDIEKETKNGQQNS